MLYIIIVLVYYENEIIFSTKTRGHPGLSGHHVRERATAEPLINCEGAMQWLVVKVTTFDTRSAIWRYSYILKL